MVDTDKLKDELKKYKRKEKKVHTFWKKLGKVFGFDKNGVIKETIEEKKQLVENAEQSKEETQQTMPPPNIEMAGEKKEFDDDNDDDV